MKPVVFYIDDEPHNLTVFEASLSGDWEICVFDNPVKALENLEKKNPCVIISDQRMPQMSGVAFLELSRKIVPHAIRIIVTGYSDENLVVESVRKAQVYDYIRKPWDQEDLQASITKAIEFYQTAEESRRLHAELVKREKELEKQTKELEASQKSEYQMRMELESWVPPFVRWAIKENIKFPVKKDIVGITFDLIDSSKLHNIVIDGRPIRSLILQSFTECIIKYGGWRESHSGDSAFGHFGLTSETTNPSEAALAVAREFRVALRGISKVSNVTVECGIALHLIKECTIDVHTVQLNTPKGIVSQKSFDSTSLEVDLLHRMEKVAHKLRGTNIVMSKEFMDSLAEQPKNTYNAGEWTFKGQQKPVEIHIVASDLVTLSEIEALAAETKIEKSAA